MLNAGEIRVCATCEVKTLPEAVEKARPHDVIRLSAGTYVVANLDIVKPLTIVGEPGVVLDGEKQGYVIRALADSITIRQVKIVGAGRSYTKDFAAIYASNADFLTVEQVEIVDAFFGLLIEKSANGRLSGNLIYGHAARMDDSGNGIHLWHCKNMRVQGNEVYKMRDGIYMEFVDESTVHDNHTHHNVRYGLHYMFSNHDTYTDNTFEHNGAGVAVMFSKFIVMRGNRFIENWGTASYGLLLKEIYDAEVEDNLFRENTVGIFIEGGSRINYTRNQLERNGWAVKVSGGCYANKFSQNNFVGNSFDVSYNAKMNDNTFDGNFWGEYTGYDLDRNGVGDVPYRPVKLFSYLVNKTPETIILLRSLFVDLINFSEKVSPIFTPDDLMDHAPLMRPYR